MSEWASDPKLAAGPFGPARMEFENWNNFKDFPILFCCSDIVVAMSERNIGLIDGSNCSKTAGCYIK